MTINSDPFSKWRRNQKNQEKPESKKEISTLENVDPFSKWKTKDTSKPDKFDYAGEAGRHLARSGSRIIETIAGMPGDVANFMKSMLGNFPSVGGIVGSTAQKLFPEQFERSLEGIPETLGSIPKTTSSQLKEFSEKATKDFTKPKNKNEEFSDEVIQDITSLMLPVKGKLPNFTKVVGTEVAAQLAKEGVKLLGGGEDKQNLSKAAIMLMGGLIKPKNALDYAESLYKKADSLLPSGARVNANKLEKSLNSLVQGLEKGVETTDKKQVIKPAKELLSKIQDGHINVDELTAAKRDINKLRGDPETVKGAKKLLSSIGKDVDHAIDLYGHQNPKFEKTFRDANEAWGTIAQSKKVSNFIKKMSGTMKIGSGLGALFEAHQMGLFPTAAVAASGYAGLKGSELLYRIMKSDVLRKYYTNIVRSAIKENSTATIQALKKLDSALLKEDPNQKKQPHKKKLLTLK